MTVVNRDEISKATSVWAKCARRHGVRKSRLSFRRKNGKWTVAHDRRNQIADAVIDDFDSEMKRSGVEFVSPIERG